MNRSIKENANIKISLSAANILDLSKSISLVIHWKGKNGIRNVELSCARTRMLFQ